MFIRCGVAEYDMNQMLEAAIWFWIPLCLIPLGMWFFISGKSKSIGKILSIVGLLLVLASSWTVPSSDSTAGGHLLLSIIAPSLLLAYGVHGMIFGGNVPVGRLDSTARLSGFVAILFSLLIFCLMHWYNLTPIWRDGEVNPYWIVFWPTFLVFSTSLCFVASVGLVTYGDNRSNESVKLAIISVIMGGISISAMVFDGYLTTAKEFRDYLWLSVADIFGTIVGLILAITAFAIVIWAYEKSLPLPENAPPPTEDEIKHVVSLAVSNLGGEEE